MALVWPAAVEGNEGKFGKYLYLYLEVSESGSWLNMAHIVSADLKVIF